MSAAQVRAWKDETVALWHYANKEAVVLDNVVNGRYPTIDQAGLKTIRNPKKDRPGPLDLSGFKQLSRATDVMDSYLAMTQVCDSHI
jgi:hypothetical protein